MKKLCLLALLGIGWADPPGMPRFREVGYESDGRIRLILIPAGDPGTVIFMIPTSLGAGGRGMGSGAGNTARIV